MNFKNTEIKIDQIISYLNENKINLSPVFQRGHVWKVNQRRGLIKNILLGRPIPAVFLFKKSDGSKYLYNILDGKQRIESLILFINNKRPDLGIKNWSTFLYGDNIRKEANFTVEINNKKYTFNSLPDDIIRDLREYPIPTIEITLDDETGIDEIISLFVDINQQGVPVSRFDIVKAMCRESIVLKKAFDLIAIEQKRGDDVFYHLKDSNISKVIKQLSIIRNTKDQKAKIDKIWQKLIEILLFTYNQEHYKPSDILKGFISKKDKIFSVRINPVLIKKAQEIFKFYWKLYRTKLLLDSKIALDQTHFYTSITTIIKYDLIHKHSEAVLMLKIESFCKLLENPSSSPRKLKLLINKYITLSGSHTTDSSKRKERENIFNEIIEKI
jgi:hypothetical protein